MRCHVRRQLLLVFALAAVELTLAARLDDEAEVLPPSTDALVEAISAGKSPSEAGKDAALDAKSRGRSHSAIVSEAAQAAAMAAVEGGQSVSEVVHDAIRAALREGVSDEEVRKEASKAALLGVLSRHMGQSTALEVAGQAEKALAAAAELVGSLQVGGNKAEQTGAVKGARATPHQEAPEEPTYDQAVEAAQEKRLLSGTAVAADSEERAKVNDKATEAAGGQQGRSTPADEAPTQATTENQANVKAVNFDDAMDASAKQQKQQRAETPTSSDQAAAEGLEKRPSNRAAEEEAKEAKTLIASLNEAEKLFGMGVGS
eukprot:TRINITY_DN122249_c0_g1_i1.p1 TRINITY_DN122249_c0_g1~~TRINITY_DN122249_c0_g1_i1.p1  ORF type:complete len:317 (+),score=122.02 TRINITY_DN122249_c0_g1_i1:107-1057(+)